MREVPSRRSFPSPLTVLLSSPDPHSILPDPPDPHQFLLWCTSGPKPHSDPPRQPVLTSFCSADCRFRSESRARSFASAAACLELTAAASAS